MLVASNFELVVGDFDYSHPPCINFDSPTFSFLAEEGSLEWINLANAITSNTNYCLDWSPSNGTCYIKVNDNGVVIFIISKYGCGKGGSLYIKVPSELCLDAFIEADKITTEWMNNK